MYVNDVMIDAFENELLKIAAYQEILEKEAISLPFGQTAKLMKALKGGAGEVGQIAARTAHKAAPTALKKGVGALGRGRIGSIGSNALQRARGAGAVGRGTLGI